MYIVLGTQCKCDTKYVHIHIMHVPFTNPFKCLRKWAIPNTMAEEYGKVPDYNKEEMLC